MMLTLPTVRIANAVDGKQRRHESGSSGSAAGGLWRRRWIHSVFAIALFTSGCRPDEIGRSIAELKSPDMDTRRKAVQSLCAGKSSDTRVIVALSAALSDPDQEVRRWACRGLGGSGSLAVQTSLERSLSDSETPVRRAAAFALRRLVPESTAYRAEILEAMKSGDGGVIVAITDWQPQPSWAIPTLVSLMNDRRPGIRRLAADALGHFGPAASSATTALQQSMNDSDDRVREAARTALEHIRSR